MNIKMSANCFSRCNAGVKKTLVITLVCLKFVQVSFSFSSSSSMLLSPSRFSACSFLPRHQFLPLPLGLLFLPLAAFPPLSAVPVSSTPLFFLPPFLAISASLQPPPVPLRFITGRVEMKNESSLVSLGMWQSVELSACVGGGCRAVSNHGSGGWRCCPLHPD